MLKDPDTKFASTWVVAQQGSGKTVLLRSMVARELPRDCSIIVMDSKGDLTGTIRKLALGDRLVVLDPSEPFAINPFDVSTANIRAAIGQLEYTFSALMGTTISPMQLSLLRPIFRAMIVAHPAPTLNTFHEII